MQVREGELSELTIFRSEGGPIFTIVPGTKKHEEGSDAQKQCEGKSMLHPAGALEEREPRPNKENWHLTGYGAHENPILGRHPWTRFSLSQQHCCAAVTCTAAGREQAPHDTQQGPPLVGSAGDVQDAGLACLALPADPCPCCPPKHLRLPWLWSSPARAEVTVK